MKSVYWKMFLIFTGILLLSFLIMAGFFYLELREFTYNRKIELLDIVAGEIYLNASDLAFDITTIPETLAHGEARNAFADSVRLYAENTDTVIWVVNKDGRMIAVSHETGYDENYFVRDFYNRTEMYMYDEESYQGYFESQESDFIATDNFQLMYGGGEERPGLTYIKIYKMQGRDYLGLDTEIGIYMHMPNKELMVARSELILAYLVPWLISLAIAGFLILLLAQSFSRPLKKMLNTTKEVAKGDFSARVKTGSRKDEIGELEKTFNGMLDQIEDLEYSRQTFISDVSHEIRTPITSINGFVGGILDGTIPPEKHNHYLSIVKSETARLNRLVNDLLVLTKLTGEDVPPEKATFDLNELIRNVIISFETDITNKGLEITVRFEDFKTLVFASRDDIERVLMNLLDNAVKFTPGGRSIYISTKADKMKIMVSIRDEGCGIPLDKLKMIWDRFYMEDSSRGRTRGGSGLGLAIVRNILAAHGETINVDSTEGEGTEFIFTLQQGV